MRLPGEEIPRLQRVFIQPLRQKRVIEGLDMSINDLVRHLCLNQHNNYATAISSPTPVALHNCAV